MSANLTQALTTALDRVPKLRLNNYAEWREKIKGLLLLNNAFGHADGSSKKPILAVGASSEVLEAWMAVDAAVKYFLIATLHHKPQDAYDDVSAADVWESLKKKYGVVKYAKAAEAAGFLRTVVYKEGTLIEDLFDQIADAGAIVAEVSDFPKPDLSGVLIDAVKHVFKKEVREFWSTWQKKGGYPTFDEAKLAVEEWSADRVESHEGVPSVNADESKSALFNKDSKNSDSKKKKKKQNKQKTKKEDSTTQVKSPVTIVIRRVISHINVKPRS
jgi:hypothetical protein